VASQSAFPPLPKSTVDRPPHAKPSISAAPLPLATGVPLEQDELIVTEKIDFASLLFGNPVTFLTFLVEVNKQTILAKDIREY